MRITPIDLRVQELTRKGMEVERASRLCRRIDALTTGKGLEEFYRGKELENLKSDDESRKLELEFCESIGENFTPM